MTTQQCISQYYGELGWTSHRSNEHSTTKPLLLLVAWVDPLYSNDHPTTNAHTRDRQLGWLSHRSNDYPIITLENIADSQDIAQMTDNNVRPSIVESRGGSDIAPMNTQQQIPRYYGELGWISYRSTDQRTITPWYLREYGWISLHSNDHSTTKNKQTYYGGLGWTS